MAHSTAATHARHASERASAITRARAWYEGGSGFLDATFLQCLSATTVGDTPDLTCTAYGQSNPITYTYEPVASP